MLTVLKLNLVNSHMVLGPCWEDTKLGTQVLPSRSRRILRKNLRSGHCHNALHKELGGHSPNSVPPCNVFLKTHIWKCRKSAFGHNSDWKPDS